MERKTNRIGFKDIRSNLLFYHFGKLVQMIPVDPGESLTRYLVDVIKLNKKVKCNLNDIVLKSVGVSG